MTQTLIDKGYAYLAANGDVMYSVRKFPNYGALSGKKIDELRAGSRVQVDEFKLDPLDFVLWKHAKAGRALLAIALGRRARRAGTSSARRCRRACSATISTCTAAAWI